MRAPVYTQPLASSCPGSLARFTVSRFNHLFDFPPLPMASVSLSLSFSLSVSGSILILVFVSIARFTSVVRFVRFIFSFYRSPTPARFLLLSRVVLTSLVVLISLFGSFFPPSPPSSPSLSFFSLRRLVFFLSFPLSQRNIWILRISRRRKGRKEGRKEGRKPR